MAHRCDRRTALYADDEELTEHGGYVSSQTYCRLLRVPDFPHEPSAQGWVPLRLFN